MTEMPSEPVLGKEAAPGAAKSEAKPEPGQEKIILYKGREPVYPKAVHGKFRTIKWIVMIVTLGVYFGLPWLRLDRGPGLPDQAWLIDFAHQRLYLFGLEIWAQEFYYVTGILVLSALGLFLATALAGRVWCGYACPQTVWTDLTVLVERLWQGDRSARIRLAKAPWSFGKAFRLLGTQLTWLLIALATGVTFVLYFRDAPTMASELLHNDAYSLAYIAIGIVAFMTYMLGAVAREQMCIYMCPWPRIQGAMFDADSLLVTYRGFRGEPRGAHRKGQSWEGRGDCIDCGQCIAACPTGIDIRHGPQLECIACALCIDACDEIMDKIGRPRKLIAYDSFRNLEAEAHGDRVPVRIVRPRTMLYTAVFTLVLAIMLYGLSSRSVLDLNVESGRDPLYVPVSGGGVRNAYKVHILNKRHETRQFKLSLAGLSHPEFDFRFFKGADPVIEVKPDELREVNMFVTVGPDEAVTLPASTSVTFTVRDLGDGTEAKYNSNFRGPGK